MPETSDAAKIAEAQPGRSRLWIAIAAATWVLVLAVLAWQTANPVTLNRAQIAVADVVVTGTVDTHEQFIVHVDKQFKGNPVPKSITVENLPETAAKPGKQYLLPLSRKVDGVYSVTPSRLPDQSPLVYPATDDAREQLQSLIPQ